VDKDTNELSFGPMRTCRTTDAYGNTVIFSAAGYVEDTDLIGGTSQVGLIESPHAHIIQASEKHFPFLQTIYADAQSLLDEKMKAKRELQENKAASAERRKLSRKIIKAALAACKNG